MAKKITPKAPIKKAETPSSSTLIAMPVSKPKVVTKEYAERSVLVDALKKRLSEIQLPKELQLESYAKINNLPLFFDAHLSRVLFMEGEIVKPYSERLKKALIMVGVDINEIIKSLKQSTDGTSEKK